MNTDSVEGKCPFCFNSIPKESIFCVHCGKKLKLDEPVRTKDTKIESAGKNLTKRFSVLFNILVLLIAIACIGGFIYFYIENKIKAPADKDAGHEEITGNLYRNTKYKFRIKFPDQWKIKRGDGPNILVKASNGKGSSINIFVKDLDVALGDINDIITLDEWAASISEKFPGSEILDKRELLVDNRKAFFAKYSLNYKALDKQADMILYNIALANENFMYSLTAGSESSQFAEEQKILDQSIVTFVIEDY